MNRLHRLLSFLAIGSTVLTSVRGQDAPPAPPSQEPVQGAAPAPAPEQERWSFSSSFFYTDPPESDGRTIAILYADRGPLHLEGRYNYEDFDTGSVFAGWTFDVTDGVVAASVTPLLGYAFGDTEGFAPGLEFDVTWKRLEWYGESEYVFDTGDGDDFFYSWSTLTYAATDAVKVGVVIERNKAVDTDLDVQRGLALEVALERVELAIYAYNLGSSDDDYAVVSLALSL